MIKLNNKSKKLLLLQRNELLTDRQKWLRRKFGRYMFTNFFVNFNQHKNIEIIAADLFNKELDTFKDFLPNFAKNIMDIGCGLAFIDINLHKFYKNNPNFYLLDKDRLDSKITYGFSSNYESYSDLQETKNILLHNNIREENIHIYDVEKKIEIKKKIDLVISLKSMGYHYPFEIYLDLFKKCCSKNTVFIFDVSKGCFDYVLFKKYFHNIDIIYEEDSIHTLKRLCCKNFKL